VAVKSSGRLSNNKKRKIDAWVEQATQAINRQQFGICEQLCQRMDEIQPGNADAASLRGVIAAHQGQAELALKLFRQAVACAPRRSEFHANLASMYLAIHQPAKALQAYKQALKLKPHQLHFQLGCASALIALRRYDGAITLMEQAHRRHPRNTDVLFKQFRAAYAAQQISRAEQSLQRLLDIDPEHIEAHYSYALLLLQAGRKQEGEKQIRAMLELEPNHAEAMAMLFDLKKYHQRDADVKRLMQCFDQSPPVSPARARLGFACGKVLDDLGEYDEAFSYFEQANSIRSRNSNYDQEQELAHMQMIMQTYSPEMLSQSSALDHDAPIFIVGMPRCGSTLVEQILASHPEVTARGECGFFEQALMQCGSRNEPLTLDMLAAYNPEQWQALGQTYLDILQEAQPQSRYYTDKTLSNIRLIGAIHCALPKARIVHVRRNPLDTCWSIYHHHLMGQLFDYGHTLGQLGYYYRMYLQLMQHWRSTLPPGVLIEMDYEALVQHPEMHTRQLLASCGLEWQAKCLNFHQAENPVRTASFLQVRNPVSTTSIGTWEPYKHHLQPLLQILGSDSHPPISP